MPDSSVTHSHYTQYYKALLAALAQQPLLAEWAQQLPENIQRGLNEQRHGDLSRWRQALERLPKTQATHTNLSDEVAIGCAHDCPPEVIANIQQELENLIPWRKGPIRVHDIFIDTEWRSDWKWQRLLPHIESLAGRQVLDIGCGNGYHCLRSYGAGAERVIGIDPSPRFVIQFYMMKHFLGDIPVDVLPLGIEALPPSLQAFDSTFSMGVLYHRRSPMDHLKELKDTLKPGGQLILETLLIEGKAGEVLVPEGRYAMMNNVWFLPTADTLIGWLKKCGFKNPRLVDSAITSTHEQRATEWMRYHSLADFLDPNDNSKTIEGHPAPMRGVFVAEAG